MPLQKGRVRRRAFLEQWMRWLGAYALALLLALQTSAAALQEYQVKAVFLFNFTQFVDWPAGTFADATKPIAICVLGDDPFGAYLDDAIRDERVDNRALIVRRYQRTEDIDVCQILFIAQSESGRLDAVFQRARKLHLLTVSEGRGFNEHGGMVGFITEDNHVRLRINVEAVRAAGLSISSKLLRVAELVGEHRDGP
jgi:hypothetical protein